MPINARNTKWVGRTLYAGIGYVKKVTLLKRNDDQGQGTVRALTLFRCRRGEIHRTGEPLQSDMTTDASCVWHVPRVELKRVGVDHLNSADRIVENTEDDGTPLTNSRYWQPESSTVIEHKLFENEIDVACLRIDPTRE